MRVRLPINDEQVIFFCTDTAFISGHLVHDSRTFIICPLWEYDDFHHASSRNILQLILPKNEERRELCQTSSGSMDPVRMLQGMTSWRMKMGRHFGFQGNSAGTLCGTDCVPVVVSIDQIYVYLTLSTTDPTYTPLNHYPHPPPFQPHLTQATKT